MVDVSLTKNSKFNSKYCILRLTDLEGTSISVCLYNTAYDQYNNTKTGTVVIKNLTLAYFVKFRNCA